jgi:protein O-mannosyl-transferase
MSFWRWKNWPLVLLILTGCCVYGRAAANHFVAWDDPDMVFQNSLLNPPSFSSVIEFWRHGFIGLYTPIPYTVWSILIAIHHGPLDLVHGATTFHILNVLLHISAGVFVFLLLRELTGGAWPAWVGAMVFLLHPLQVEPADWVAGMNNVMCGMFALAALWQYVVFAKTSIRRHFVCATILFAAALLSKPTAVVVPLMAIILDRWALKRPIRKIFFPMLLWIAMAVPMAWITHRIQPATVIESPPIEGRLLVAADAIGFYVTKLVYPIHLVIDYERTPESVLDQPWLAIPGLAAVFLGAIVWLASRKKAAWLRPPLMLVPVSLLPVLGLVAFDFQAYSTVADRYMYLGMFGVALLAAGVMSRLGPSLIGWTVAVMLLFLLAARSFDQTAAWHDTQSLATQEFLLDPDSPTGHKIDAFYLSNTGRLKEAEIEYRAAVAALTEHPHGGDGAVWFGYGNLLSREKRYGEAIPEYQIAVTRMTGELATRAYLNMGVAFYELGNKDEARRQFLNALRTDPNYQDAKKNLTLLESQ